jgi:integrase
MTARRQRGSSLQRVVLKDGSVRWRFRLDLLADPKTGKRRQRTLTYRTEAEAVKAQAAARTAIEEQNYIEPDRVTASAWLEAWQEVNARTWRPATRQSYRHTLAPVIKELGERRLQDLRREHVEAIVRHLIKTPTRTGGPRSARSTAYALQLLRTALEAAVAEDLIKRNPAKHVKAPPQQSKEMSVWTGDEVAAFLAHVADDDLAGGWHLTAHGLRRGEVIGLRWCDVDLEVGEVHVRQSRTSAFREVAVVPPKTKRGRRTVPLTPAAVAALRQTRQRTLLDNPAIPFSAKRDGNRLVVVNRAGEPVHPDTWGHWFDRHVLEAGLRRIRLHDMRHTAATVLLQAGIPSVVVAGILGHSPAVLLTTYAHALPDAKRDAMDVLADLYRSGT